MAVANCKSSTQTKKPLIGFVCRAHLGWPLRFCRVMGIHVIWNCLLVCCVKLHSRFMFEPFYHQLYCQAQYLLHAISRVNFAPGQTLTRIGRKYLPPKLHAFRSHIWNIMRRRLSNRANSVLPEVGVPGGPFNAQSARTLSARNPQGTAEIPATRLSHDSVCSNVKCISNGQCSKKCHINFSTCHRKGHMDPTKCYTCHKGWIPWSSATYELSLTRPTKTLHLHEKPCTNKIWWQQFLWAFLMCDQ